MDKSTKKLLNGTMVYFIGNALTQLLSLALLRFITGHIPPEAYGIYNLVVTVSNLVTPFVTLQIVDALFKFLLRAKDEGEKGRYITIGFMVLLCSMAVSVAGVFVIDRLFVPIPYTGLVAGYLVANNLLVVYHRLTRSLGKSNVYVQGNLLKTAVYLLLQIALIYVFHMGAETLFLAVILSDVTFFVFAELRIHALKRFRPKSFDGKTFRRMLKFSVPLIPNTAFWWLTSSVNTLIVSARCGLDINGIYTVANKFSSVLTMVTSVFNMAWQESAITEFGKPGFEAFFTKTFHMFIKVIFGAIGVLIPLIRVLLPVMLDESYHAAIAYAPFLLVVTGLSTLSGFLAQIFTGEGKTYRSLWTSMVGMAVNILLILSLVDSLGLWAAVIGSFGADGVMAALRLLLTRPYFTGKIEWGKIFLCAAALAVGIVLYQTASVLYNLLWLVAVSALVLVLNWGLVKDLTKVLLGKIKSQKKGEMSL